MVNLFLFFFFLLSSSSSFFQTVDHSTLPRETRIRIRIHARMCFGDAHNVPSPQYGNGSWVVSSSCSCTCTHPRTIEFYHIEHTRPSRPLVVSTPPPSFASFSPLYSITLLYNTRKSQYMYIQCTNHRVFLFFFFTLLILTRTRTPPLETDCASYRSPGGEIRVHVSNHACDFEELENGKPFFLLLSFRRKILPFQYIYIYL